MNQQQPGDVRLGAFSVSLSVDDLAASETFYRALGFTQVGGAPAENWLIMRNGSTTIGLFQGMFDGNVLTFNPGWDQDGRAVSDYTDIRRLQQILQERGLSLDTQVADGTSGPASLTLRDPDGNMILLDQHR